MSRLDIFHVLLAVVLGLSSCTDGRTALLERLDADKRRESEFLDAATRLDYSWMNEMASRCLSKELDEATTASLQHPEPAAALLVTNATQAQLTVYWIEDSPSVRQVAVGIPGKAIRLSIPEDYQEENQHCAKRSVIFRVSYAWEGDIPSVLTQKQCVVSLVGMDGRQTDPIKVLTPGDSEDDGSPANLD